MGALRLDLTTDGLEQRLKVIRRDDDGMVWVQIYELDREKIACCIALDSDEAWELARSMLATSDTAPDA